MVLISGADRLFGGRFLSTLHQTCDAPVSCITIGTEAIGRSPLRPPPAYGTNAQGPKICAVSQFLSSFFPVSPPSWLCNSLRQKHPRLRLRKLPRRKSLPSQPVPRRAPNHLTRAPKLAIRAKTRKTIPRKALSSSRSRRSIAL